MSLIQFLEPSKTSRTVYNVAVQPLRWGGDSKASFVALRDMIAKDIIAAETLTAFSRGVGGVDDGSNLNTDEIAAVATLAALSCFVG